MSQSTEQEKRVNSSAGRGAPSLDNLLIIRLVIAAVILAVAVIVKMPAVVRIILLIVSIVAAGYDIALDAVNAVEEKNFFAAPLLILLITVISIVIGYAAEGAALVLVYQAGKLLMTYVECRTRQSARELLEYRDAETISRVEEIVKDRDATTLRLEPTIFKSADAILKFAMVIAVAYAIILPLINGNCTYRMSIHRALMILAACTPLSVVAAMPLTALVGLCFSAQQGVVFSKVSAMEDAAGVNTAIFDKAGVFTAETPHLLSVQSDILDSRTFMNFAAHAVYYSEQPVAKAIAARNDQEYKLDLISDFVDIPGSGVELKIGGSPVTLAIRDYYILKGINIPQEDSKEGQTYYMTVAGRYVGKLVISIDMNEESLDLASDMRDAGVERCILLTEDSGEDSHKAAEELGFSEFYGECDTARKLKLVEDLSHSAQSRSMYIYAKGFEAHSAADVDLRISQKGKFADAIVQPEDANNIPFALQICRRMCDVATKNAVFAFVVKALLIFLSMIGYSKIWFVLFVDLAAGIGTMLNSIRVTKESIFSNIIKK